MISFKRTCLNLNLLTITVNNTFMGRIVDEDIKIDVM